MTKHSRVADENDHDCSECLDMHWLVAKIGDIVRVGVCTNSSSSHFCHVLSSGHPACREFGNTVCVTSKGKKR